MGLAFARGKAAVARSFSRGVSRFRMHGVEEHPLGASELARARAAYTEVFRKLCSAADDRQTYADELEKMARSKRSQSGTEVLDMAIAQLTEKPLKVDRNGRVLNAPEIGPEFETVYQFVKARVELWIIAEEGQLGSPQFPLPERYKEHVRALVGREAVIIALVKTPPESVKKEIAEISEQQFSGLTIWLERAYRPYANMSPALERYLEYATVRIMHTGITEENGQAKRLNQALEEHDGFERVHETRVVASIGESEKNESLKHVLMICAPIVASIKVLEKFFPHGMHSVGGMLDDLFGAIIPDVSQSFGKTGPLKERVRKAVSVFLSGSVGLPVSFGFGWLSSQMYTDGASLGQRMLAGVIFALACCAGTVGTSIAAVVKAYKGVNKFQQEQAHGGKQTTAMKKLRMAINEAIWNIPFRIGHTVIGVPLQIGLGMAAGAFRFFHSGIFVMVVGMLETIFGAAIAYAYPHIANAVHKRKLKTL